MKAKYVLPVLLLITASARAQEKPDVVPQATDGGSLFFEVTGQYLSFSHRDLDGNMVLGNADQVFFIPRVKSSIGFGVGFGRRFRSGLWSVSYLVSGHDVTFQGRNGTAVSRLVQINSRTFLLKSYAAMIFAHFGLDFPWLKVYADAADKNGKTYDATYLGVGANAGAGLLLPISSRMFFSGSLVYRFIGYLYAKGPGRGIDVTDLFDDRTGPRHRIYLRAPVLALELSLGYTL
jgi:opacity protein-like surface antigen